MTHPIDEIIGFCAPGRQYLSRIRLILDGVPFVSMIETPLLAGKKDIILARSTYADPKWHPQVIANAFAERNGGPVPEPTHSD